MRTHHCGLVDDSLVGQSVTLCGWADTRRDHGGVIFVDLRDHEGIVQVVVEPENGNAFRVAEGVKYEYCLRITGRVRARPASQVNDRLRTGKIEVVADEVEVLNASAPLPFMRVRSQSAIRKKPGRTEYQRGILSVGEDGRQEVRITGSQGSGILRSMSEANCMVVLHHDQHGVQAGDEVDVILFDGLV